MDRKRKGGFSVGTWAGRQSDAPSQSSQGLNAIVSALNFSEQSTTSAKRGRPKASHMIDAPVAEKRTISTASRAGIAAAQKKRWAKAKKAAK